MKYKKIQFLSTALGQVNSDHACEDNGFEYQHQASYDGYATLWDNYTYLCNL